MNNNRKDIVRSSGKYFVLWGILLTVFSLLVFTLWKTTGKAVWNNLWFALPAIGYPLARWIKIKDAAPRAENYISRINGGIWGSFGVFACSIALFTVLYSLLGDSQLTAIVLGARNSRNYQRHCPQELDDKDCRMDYRHRRPGHILYRPGRSRTIVHLHICWDRSGSHRAYCKTTVQVAYVSQVRSAPSF